MASIECPICMDFFGWEDKHERAPKFLRCGHTICAKCLVDIAKNSSESFCCPICRKKINDNKNVDDIPVNRLVFDVLREKGLIENIGSLGIDENVEKYDYSFDIIVLGCSGVGKTSLILRFVDNKFQDDFITTLGIDYKVKIIKTRRKKIKLTIKDTAGQERYQSITFSQLRSAHGAFFVYDCSVSESLNKLDSYVKNFLNQNYLKSRVMFLIANKVDLPGRVISEEEGREYAEKYSMDYLETSAKNNVNVEIMFKNIAVHLLEEFENITLDNYNKTLRKSIGRKKKCC